HEPSRIVSAVEAGRRCFIRSEPSAQVPLLSSMLPALWRRHVNDSPYELGVANAGHRLPPAEKFLLSQFVTRIEQFRFAFESGHSPCLPRPIKAPSASFPNCCATAIISRYRFPSHREPPSPFRSANATIALAVPILGKTSMLSVAEAQAVILEHARPLP